MTFPVFDLHCDTSSALLGSSMNEAGSLLKNKGHIDLTRAAGFPGYCQCFGCFTTPDMEKWFGISPTVVFERELATIQREVYRNREKIGIVYSPEEIEENRSAGKMSAVLTLEGTAGIHYDPGLLENLYQIGFRISSLGWNESNPLTGSHLTGEGLSEQGREYVRQAQRLGILVDVSHISDRGFWDILDMTEAPVIATHSNSRAVWNHSRNLTDEMFLAICKTGGVAGFNQYADFIGDKPTLDSVCDHILHFLELEPSGKHLALGGDLDGCEAFAEGFTGIESYPAMARQLLTRGVGEETVMDIFWNNAMGVMRSAVRNHKKFD